MFITQPLEPRLLLTTAHFTIDAAQNVHAISRFIYGVNQALSGAYANNTFTRSGGNRLTAYNWENNASNAGSDWYFQNDNYLGGGSTPGGALIPTITDAAGHNAGALLTIPINGYVSADKNGDGDVRYTGNTWNGTGWVQGTYNPNYLEQRFKQERARKGSAFTLTPDTADPFVYQDEFANWVKTNYPYGQTDPNKPIWFSLDNEPDLWNSTHAEVHPAAPTYAEMVQKTAEYAAAIKDVQPNTLIFGPVNYGWQGYIRLQDAPDANNRDFQEFYLQQMQQASAAAGKRLLDVLDVHWYPEAHGTNNIRITEQDSSPATVAARLQAPRSLWDPTYTETSWITQWSTLGPIKLIPRLQAKINGFYPGTKLAITEYNYGGGNHISGGIAQADVLGIFGRDGVFAANEWKLASNESFIGGAFQMFRNYDGANGTFGDTSISATNDAIADTSIYASYDSATRSTLTMVALNKTAATVTGAFNLSHLKPGTTATVYRLTSASATPQAAGTITIGANGAFNYDMPAYSVSTLKINLTSPAPRAWTGAGDGSHWSDANNWSGSTVPQASDEAVISVPSSNPTIQIDSGNFVARSLESDEAITLSNSASLAISGNATIRSTLSLQNSAQFGVTPGTSALAKLNGLSITGSSKLDLNDNDLLLDYTGSSQLSAIQQLINTARANGAWTGTGLTSSAARDNANHNTTLGAMEATDFKALYGSSASFDNEPIDSTAVLVKYTYYGDTDFNGTVNFDDYVRTDNGFNNHLTGWMNGDFDGNGAVNFDDYVLIDLAFNTQAGTLRRRRGNGMSGHSLN